MENDTLIVISDDKEIEMKILFTVTSVHTNKDIVCYVDPEDEEGNAYASYYNDERELFPIEDEQEWEFVESVFEAFLSEDDEEIFH